MKIIVIGASGTVGRAVAEELSRQHEVIRVGRTHGDEQVDITSQHSAGAVREKLVQSMPLSQQPAAYTLAR